ncbi:MAG: hypothetical protein JSW27_14305 [Phycisphaerales bacterium]|nr:MAG: hypothetical protein JSW27_14305 [Phycisphaerales bacterium]
MKKQKKDILGRAIDELKEQGRSAEPPQEVVNETLTRLAQAQATCDPADRRYTKPVSGSKISQRLWPTGRWAVAAAVLLTAGYAVGRISAPAEPDIDQLRAALLPSLAASLEPAIRQRVLEETRQDYQQAMVAGYIRMKDELTEQYRADLNRFAVQTFAASNTATNELLGQLVQAVQLSHRQDRERVAAALAQLEASRREDTAEFRTALAALAAQTESEIQHTKEEIVYLLANVQTDASVHPPEESSEIN